MEIVIQIFQKGKSSHRAMQSFVQGHSAVADGARTPRRICCLSASGSPLPVQMSVPFLRLDCKLFAGSLVLFTSGKPTVATLQKKCCLPAFPNGPGFPPETRGETSPSSHCLALPAGGSTGAHEPPPPGLRGAGRGRKGDSKLEPLSLNG